MLDDELGGDPQDQTLRLWADQGRSFVEAWIERATSGGSWARKKAMARLKKATLPDLAESYRAAMCFFDELLSPGMASGYRQRMTENAQAHCAALVFKRVRSRKTRGKWLT